MALDLLQKTQIAPSVLSADFSQLGNQIDTVMEAGARVIHIDVMDGHFVPPITIGPLIVDAVSDQVHDRQGILDVHLMIERPETQVANFAKAGADVITVHAEATPHVHYGLKMIREAGCLAGISICPGTPVETIDGLQEYVDLVLCMSVNPGWGGQKFIGSSLDKIKRLRDMFPDNVVIEVDGGVDSTTAVQCVGSGASLLVAGSAVFSSKDPAEQFKQLSRTI